MSDDVTDPNLARLLKRRTKEPELPSSATPESLNLSFSTGIEDEESKQKIKYLAYQTETLEGQNVDLENENERLRNLLRTRENDMFKLKNDIDELRIATGGGGLGSEKAIQRIVELSKKNRDLVSLLETSKSANKRLTNKLSNQEVERKLKSAVKARTQETNDSKDDTEKLLKEELCMLRTKTTESTHQMTSLRQENKLLAKLLQREVGEGTTVQSVLANPNSWKGRSEQIAMLQTKVSSLKSDTSSEPPTRLERQRQNDIRTLENNRKHQLQELKNDKEKLQSDLSQQKKNYDAVKARNSTLSGELKTVRGQLAALVEKGRNDDELINQLFTEKNELPRDADLDEVWRRQDEITLLKQTVAEKNSRVKQLEEEITRGREKQVTLSDLRPPTHPRSAPGDVDVRAAKPGGFDTTYLLKATEVERERLFELTEVLNNRISELEKTEIESEIQRKKHARHSVHLERLVESLKCKRIPRCDGCNRTATLNEAHYKSQLAVSLDEVEVLKTHLSALQTDRQTTLHKYKDLLNKSRQVFLVGLKEFQNK